MPAAYDRFVPLYRLPKLALGEDFDLRIHPDFLDATVFICIEKQKGGKTVHQPIGTGFLVDIPDESGTWRYVVTARHCIEDPGRPELFIRANTVLSAPPTILGYVDLPCRQSAWHKHKTADVAAILLPEQTSTSRVLNCHAVQPKWFIDSDYKIRLRDPNEQYHEDILTACRRLDGFDVQPGDEVFFTGLFTETAGESRNLPVARFGNISRMPTEQLLYMETKARGRIGVVGYLVECHSRGGLSGSPAFVHRDLFTATMVTALKNTPRPVVGSINFVRALIGLVSAHFDTYDEASQRQLAKSDAKFNSGMAIVTPTENIKELLLKDEDVLKDRRRRTAQTAATSSATADSAQGLGVKRKNRDIPIPKVTRKKFFTDLEKATRKLTPSS